MEQINKLKRYTVQTAMSTWWWGIQTRRGRRCMTRPPSAVGLRPAGEGGDGGGGHMEPGGTPCSCCLPGWGEGRGNLILFHI